MVYAICQQQIWMGILLSLINSESTLKPRETISCFKNIVYDERSIADLNVIVEIDHPNNDIYRAEGTVIVSSEKYNYDIKNILLRVRLK